MTSEIRDLNQWLFSIDEELKHPVFHSITALHDDYDTDKVRHAKTQLETIAKENNLPWLGVYARHWELQHRVNDGAEGATAVADAVSAFEQSLRPENRDCPQSICATQDLAMAYTATDGPGYADEVISACNDTLERIDPTWPCYDCVSAELRTGLINKGQHSKAQHLIDDVEVEIRKAGGTPSSSYPQDRLVSLLDAGDLEEAGKLARALDLSRYAFHGEFSEEEADICLAEARLATGDPEPAKRLLDDQMDPLGRPATAWLWLRLVDRSLESGIQDNTDRVSTIKVVLAQQQFRQGTFRRAFSTSISAGVWAARRGSVTTAKRCLALAERAAAELAKPLDAPELLAELAAGIDSAPDGVSDSAPLDAAAEGLEAKLAGGSLSNDEFATLAQMRRAQGWSAEAEELLWRQLESFPEDNKLAESLLGQLADQRDIEGLVRLSAIVEAEHPLLSNWCLVQSAVASGDWAAVVERCSSILEMDPDALNTRRLLTFAHRTLGDYPASAAMATAVLDASGARAESEPDSELRQQLMAQHQSDAWQGAISGSLAEDWALVRRTAAVLGMELTSDEGPVEEEWEWVSITFPGDDFSELTYAAQRTGPATARILTVALAGQPQKVNDLVVFSPELLDPIPEDPEERERFVQRFGAIHTLDRGGYDSVLLRGYCSDAEEHDLLRQALADDNIPVWSYSSGPTELETGQVVFDVHSAIGYNGQAQSKRLVEIVESVTANWAVNLEWPEQDPRA